MMKKYIKTIAVIVFLGTLFSGNLKAQGISDLGVVWEKTYGTGNIRNIKVNKAGDGYIACGNGGSQEGLIVEFDEAGKEIRRVTTHVNQVYTPRAADASAEFVVAFKTDDGGVIAFGIILDKGAPAVEKTTNYTGLAMSENPFLLYGAWYVKYDSDLQILSKGRIRGPMLLGGWQISDGNIVLAGMDMPRQGVAGTSDDITLLRKYDQNGTLLIDQRADYREIGSIYQFPGTDTFIAATPDRILKISAAGNTLTYTSNIHANALGLPGVTVPNMGGGITPTTDGGYFVRTPLHSVPDVPQNYNNGNGLYRLSNTNTIIYYTSIKPSTQQYAAPLLLPGNNSPVKYVGTLYECPTYGNCTNYLYELTDQAPFSPVKGPRMPDGTTLKAVSMSDGFFTVGSSGGLAKIAKLSTCVNFKVTTLPDNMIISKPYNPTINVSLPINFEGAKGTVDYFLKGVVKSGVVNGKTVGQELEVTSGAVATNVGGTGLAFDLNRTYNLSTEYAVIEYTLSLNDSYTTAGIPQSCGQTYIFRVMTAPQTDVVAMPTIKKDASTTKVLASIKNIGQSTFSNYKITIYQDALGNANNYTYTHPTAIQMNETARFKIDLPAALTGVSKVVVSFNDSGSGAQDQMEMNDKEFTYEVEL